MKKTGSKVSFNKLAPETMLVEPPRGPQNAIWYSPDEIKTFRKTLKDPPPSNCRKHFVKSILDFQALQKDNGIEDPKALRQMSRANSKESIKRALRKARSLDDV